MRKTFFVLVGLLFLFSSKAFSAPCYGVQMPKKKKIFLGYQSHYLLKRYLEDEYGKVRSYQQFILLSYGITDWLSLDLKGGAGFVKQRPLDSSEIDYPSGFSGGYGFRLKLYYDLVNKINVIFGFHHISVHPKKIHLENVKNKTVLDDWQVSLLFSKEFLRFTPYIGVKWSRTDYIHWIEDERKRRMSDLTKSVGLILGLDIPCTQKSYINLEAQIFDEEAVSFAWLYKF